MHLFSYAPFFNASPLLRYFFRWSKKQTNYFQTSLFHPFFIQNRLHSFLFTLFHFRILHSLIPFISHQSLFSFNFSFNIHSFTLASCHSQSSFFHLIVLQYTELLYMTENILDTINTITNRAAFVCVSSLILLSISRELLDNTHIRFTFMLVVSFCFMISLCSYTTILPHCSSWSYCTRVS